MYWWQAHTPATLLKSKKNFPTFERLSSAHINISFFKNEYSGKVKQKPFPANNQ